MAKILIVDDNAANRSLVAALAEHLGHQPLEAEDGEKALELARREHPQLIVSDILMPTMDGFELVHRLREDAALEHTQVVLCTAHYHEQEAHNLAASCGVARVLIKPCEPQLLLEVIESTLNAAPAPPAIAAADFDREHLRLMTDKLSQKVEQLQAANLSLMNQIAERRRAEEKAQHLNRVYAVLSGINSLIVRASRRDELFREACRLAVDQGLFNLAWIGWLEPSGQAVKPVAWSGDDVGYVRVALNSGAAQPLVPGSLSTDALHLRQPAVCNDIEAAEPQFPGREAMLERGYRSAAVLPLTVGAGCVGCLALYTQERNFFDEAEMRLLKELAGDISFALDHIEKAERLNFLAYYDALTGIANRTLFHERLERQIAGAAREGQRVAVIVAQIDRFDTINDSYGRYVGDQLLKQMVVRLLNSVGDPGEIARVGATDFAVLISDARIESNVLHALERLWWDCFDPEFTVGEVQVHLTVRAGIALYPADGAEAEQLLKNAEAALKRAQATTERYLFYTQKMSERLSQKLALERKLRDALDNNEFVLHYQPKVSMGEHGIVGVEALMRWENTELGLVSPSQFIPLLEETGMIVEVGAWALRQALFDRSLWMERKLPAPRVAVNVSTVQLRRNDFVRTVADILNTAPVAAEAGLDIEVTESVIMEDVEAHIEKLRALRELGVKIAIDDFGTGYSSLGYLAKLPVDALKIDRSFIMAMVDDANAMTLVSTMISLAHSLRLQVVAEGVETVEQAKMLRLLRCDQKQGYLFGRPMPFDDMAAVLANPPTFRTRNV